MNRLPGRLRLYIPLLEKLPRRWHTLADLSVELIMLQTGVTSVKIEPVTGNVLLHYIPQQIDEPGIITWLKTLVEAFLASETPAKLKTEADVRMRFKQLKEVIVQNKFRS